MTPMSLEEITAISLIKANRLKEAADILEACTAAIRDRCSYLLGIIHAKRKDYQKAVDEFQQIPVSSSYYAMALSFLKYFKEMKNNPYIRLKSGDREEAASIWEEELKQNPNNLEIWHNLGILFYWQAKDLEEKGKFSEAKSIWENTIGYWAVVLASDGFWLEWAKKRANTCGIPELGIPANQAGRRRFFTIPAQEDERVDAFLSEVKKVREGVEKQFQNLFIEKASNLGPGNAELYKQLFLDWNHEWSVAHLLGRSKKIYRIVEYANRNDIPSNLTESLSRVLDHIKGFDIDILLNMIEQGLDVKDCGFNDVPACGPIMLKFLNRIDAAREFANKVSTISSKNIIIDKLLRLLAPTFTRLRFYLDANLGEWLVIIDVGQYDKAVKGIKSKLQLDNTEKSIARNLRLLLTMACYCQAESLYIHRSAENAFLKFKACIEALNVAKVFAPDVMSDPSPFDCDIPQLIAHICKRISQSIDHGLISIQEGIQLINNLSEIAPRGRDAACKRALEALEEKL